MTKHDWIVLAGVVVSIVIAVGAVLYHGGRIDDHVMQMDQRLQRVERTTDAILWHLVETGTGAAAQSVADED